MTETPSFSTYAADIEGWRAGLVQQYRQVLQKSMFTNRKEMRPAQLGTIAEAEVEALLDYLKQVTPSGEARGAQLCEAGLSEISVLRLGQATRQFFIASLQDGRLSGLVHAYDEYHNGVVQGYMHKGEQIVLSEQERSRYAHERVLARDGKAS
ncbi:MAG: hypothetical protein ACOYYS_18275 [Chloroflexota bacterium]